MDLQSSFRQLQQKKKPPKGVIYFFMIMIFLGMVFFVYNWWKCRQSRVLEDEVEMNEYDFDDEDDIENEKEDEHFRKAGNYADQSI